MSEQERDLVQIEDPKDGFKIICKRCGSEKCEVSNTLAMGGSQTGMYGSVSIVCNSCNQTEEIYGG